MSRPIKVIVADDDEFDRYVARRILGKESAIGAIGECTDGEELLDLLASPAFAAEWGPHPPPVLILLDINMPKLSGFELLRQLTDDDLVGMPPASLARARAAAEQTCVVLMLTSSVSQRDRQEADRSPLVSGYIEKPIDSNKLSKALEALYPTTAGPATD